MNIHDIDSNVLEFVIEKFNQNFSNENSWSYIYSDKNSKIEINKRQILKWDEKITIDFFSDEDLKNILL